MKWQPMATAPMDGTTILCRFKNGRHKVLYFTGYGAWDGGDFEDGIETESLEMWCSIPPPPEELEEVNGALKNEELLLLEEIREELGPKRGGSCPVCGIYSHKGWCWYPKLVKLTGGQLDDKDKKFLGMEVENGGNT